MISHGVLAPGPAVLSVDLAGETYVADLTATGKIRFDPPVGGPPQTFDTPAGFVRALRLYVPALAVRRQPESNSGPLEQSRAATTEPFRILQTCTRPSPTPPPLRLCAQGKPVRGWSQVKYDGVGLKLLREAVIGVPTNAERGVPSLPAHLRTPIPPHAPKRGLVE